MKPVGIYVRLSEVRPGEETVSLDTQEQDARALASRKGWEVAPEVYRDAGRSAWQDNRERPAFDAMLADLEAGKLGGVLAWKQDRLGRRVSEVAALLDRCRQLGAIVATVTDVLDTTTPSGRMAAQVIAAAAELESANTSIRVRRAMQARAERGDAHGGPRPYGYDRGPGGKLVVNPEEAKVIKECAARALGGEPVGAILRDLHLREVPTSTGRSWGRRSLVNTLTSSRIAALREHEGREVEGKWEPIIDRQTHEDLRATLARSKVRRSKPRAYFLSGGLLVCGRCGSRLKGRAWDAADGRPSRRAQYACANGMEHRGCGLAITAAPLEDFIAGVVIARLSSEAFRARLEAAADDPAVDDLYRRLGKLEAAAEDVAAAFGAGELDRRGYKVAAERNEQDRRVLERELRSRVGERSTILTGAPSTEVALREWWEAASLHQRHALTAAVISEIRVGPAHQGKRFTPERLDIDVR
jgi:DNA invertase Pin-like site-specific DNA recombinase